MIYSLFKKTVDNICVIQTNCLLGPQKGGGTKILNPYLGA